MRSQTRLLAVALLAALTSPAPTLAQAPTTAVSSGAKGKVLDPTDLAGWKSIRASALSDDGRWFGYVLAPNEGDAEFIVRGTAPGSAERRFPIGEPAGAGTVALAGNGKWAAVATFPKAAEAKRLRRDKKPLQNGVTLVALGGGEQREFEKVQRFSFAGDSPNWLVMQRYPAEGATSSDLLLVDLRDGAIVTIGSVGEWALDDAGALLAYTTQTRDQVGNSVQVRSLATDVVRALDSEKAVYRRLTWADSGQGLAVLRGKVDSASSDTAYSVVGWSSVAAPNKVQFTPGADFPVGMRVSPDRAPRWGTGFSTIFFGVIERRTQPEGKNGRPDVKPVAGGPGAMQSPAGTGLPDDELPTLVIWHGKGDARLQSQQQVQENGDKSFSYLAAYRVADRAFLQLANADVRDATLAPRDRYAVGSDRRPYERRDNIDGGFRRDVYVIDTRTGERTLAVKESRFGFLPSPDGTKALYFADGEYHVYDFVARTSTTITKGAPTTFVDTEDDHNVDRPPVAPLGWSADNQSVLLFDNWDVWKAPVTAGTLTNLTGNGRRDRIRYTRRIAYNPREKGIDLTQPLYLQSYGERTKKEGLSRVLPGKPGAQPLLWDDAKFFFSRAKSADLWAYTRQTVAEFPDVHAIDGDFKTPRRLTDANPQQKDYAWSSGARLVDYVSEKGDSLQGALWLPANYEPGKKYPTVVYIYEKLSQELHLYAVPNETRAFNPSVYTSRGYAVFKPDIVYKINDPGMSAVWAVVPAVKALIATGIPDPDRIGLHGHSWGGYQSSFLATQTGKLFAGIVTGAPLTDLVSMYSSVYWNSGSANQAIFESSQGRFKGSYIENHEAYVRNSPVFFADKVETPVMILHNEKDGAVDFNQGITWFNTLREQEKNVILLQYVGENHGLAVAKNQKDYTVRMMEYFDTFLRGKEPPEWILKGVPRLKMEEHLKSRLKKIAS